MTTAMAKMSDYAFVAAMLSTGLATILYLLYAISGVRAARMQTAGVPGTTGVLGFVSGPRTAAIGRYATIVGWLAVIAMLASLVFRTIATGHGPFANMYEFSMAFAFGVLAAYMWFERRYHQRILALVALPLALLMMFYAATIPADIEPLVPALQNNLLLTVHVAVAIVAYGSFTLAFAASYLYLLQTGSAPTLLVGTAAFVLAAAYGMATGGVGSAVPYGLAASLVAGVATATVRRFAFGATGSDATPETGAARWGLPKPQVLDEIGYHAVVVGFPFLTLTIILGAVWADVAWGSYWSWDPKETASLVTWFIYGAYLHARVMRGWRGSRAAWLLVLGFEATLFTYFGNYFFGGLHSYAGLG
jgi:cytochrome c-type biogenesis protein CcsB